MANPLFFIVDDDPAISRLVQVHLRTKYAADVRIFHSGEECIEHLSLNPAVILLDYELGGESRMNGKDVWMRIKNSSAKAKVIMMSAQGEGKLVLELVRMGLRDYVIKDAEAMNTLDDILDEYFAGKE